MVKFFSQLNAFDEALKAYYGDLSQGNYDTLSDYTQNSKFYKWTTEEELSFVEGILSKKFSNNEFTKNFKNELPFGLPRIANLMASIHFLESQKTNIAKTEEYNHIQQEQQLLLEIEAGMPAACLAYLGAIRCSTLSNELKIAFISDVLLGAVDRVEQFGVLGKVLFKVAVEDFANILEQETTDSDLAELKTHYQADLESYKAQAKSYEINELIENMPLLEQIIVHNLSQLNNDIGTITILNGMELCCLNQKMNRNGGSKR